MAANNPAIQKAHTMSAHQAIDYELAGRLPSQTFRDLRSASKARRRHKANLEKYYSYRHINHGQLGQLHHELPWDVREPQVLLSETPTTNMSKQTLYREAQAYPRPPKYHRRHPDFLRNTKTCFADKRRHARRHAIQWIEDEVEEARDPFFMSLVTGESASGCSDRYHLDEHIFRRCDVCWPELQEWYVDFEMCNANGEVVGQWDDRWDVGIATADAEVELEVGKKVGFAGRAKTGALFLMGMADLRNWPEAQPYRYDEEWAEWGAEEAAISVADLEDSETWSWHDVPHAALDVEGGDWEVLSSCSSWSEVSG